MNFIMNCEVVHSFRGEPLFVLVVSSLWQLVMAALPLLSLKRYGEVHTYNVCTVICSNVGDSQFATDCPLKQAFLKETPRAGGALENR